MRRSEGAASRALRHSPVDRVPSPFREHHEKPPEEPENDDGHAHQHEDARVEALAGGGVSAAEADWTGHQWPPRAAGAVGSALNASWKRVPNRWSPSLQSRKANSATNSTAVSPSGQ